MAAAYTRTLFNNMFLKNRIIHSRKIKSDQPFIELYLAHLIFSVLDFLVLFG